MSTFDESLAQSLARTLPCVQWYIKPPQPYCAVLCTATDELLFANAWTQEVVALRVSAQGSVLSTRTVVPPDTSATAMTGLSVIDVDNITATLFVLPRQKNVHTVVAYCIKSGEMLRKFTSRSNLYDGSLAVDGARDRLYTLDRQHSIVSVHHASTGKHIGNMHPRSAVCLAVCASTGDLCIRNVSGEVWIWHYNNNNGGGGDWHFVTATEVAGHNVHVAMDAAGDVVYTSYGPHARVDMFRVADGRRLGARKLPGAVDSLRIAETGVLIATHFCINGVTALRLPARRRWQPDVNVHGLFDADGGGGFLCVVSAVLATAIFRASHRRRAHCPAIQTQRLPLELLCLILEQLAPVVIVDDDDDE